MSGQHTVLVIDDDPIFQAIVADIPALSGATIQSAYDGRQALRLLDANADSITLILTDLHMPDINGIELILEFGNRGMRQPIVIISSADKSVVRSAETLASVSGLDIRGSLPKPVDMVALSRLIEGCLGRRAREA